MNKKMLLLLGAILVVASYQNCAPIHKVMTGAESSSSLAGSNLTAQEALKVFEDTLYPTLQTNCASCHGQFQQPQFAVADSAQSQDTLVNMALVNLQDPATSRLVIKVDGGHQSFPATLARQLETDITNWAAGLAAGGGSVGGNTGGSTGGNTGGTTGGSTGGSTGGNTGGSTGGGSTGGTPGDATSVQIFEQTLYPLLNNNCAQCHGQNQQPLFAVSNTTQAHDTLLNSALVSLQDPASSRIVVKIAGGHQGFPSSLSTDLETAVASWATNLEANGGSTPLPEPAKLEATFTSIHNLILVPKCASCHSPSGSRPAEDYTDYNTTIRTGGIAKGNASGSELYKECSSGSMPQGSSRLSSEELTVLRDWINAGAQNN